MKSSMVSGMSVMVDVDDSTTILSEAVGAGRGGC